jgi:hypothetical protein
MKTPTWNDLAISARWRGVVSFIRNWVGPFESVQGMAPKDLDLILRGKALNLPTAVREWYLLAANWNQGRLAVWIRAEELAACDGVVWILTDTQGITHWGVRVADLDIEDPPVVSREANIDIVSPSFSKFVAAMIVNDALFDSEFEAPVELVHGSARAEQMCLFSSCFGDFFADGLLESATVVMFAYPGHGPVYGKSRTSAGRELLMRLRRQRS